MKEYEFIAKTLYGLEDVLMNELEQLSVKNIKKLKRAVKFHGDTRSLYQANLNLRTALRIIKPLHYFEISNAQSLYEAVREVDWSAFFNLHQTFMIDSVVHSGLFKHTGFAALKVKDAIADQFRDKYNKRPSVDTRHPDIIFNLFINGNKGNISIDSSGMPLFKRGYRKQSVDAPLSEVLAAGMLALSGWDKKSNFVDCMCGSGTLLNEAGMLAKNIPAGWFRDSFGFQRWQDYDHLLWRNIRMEEAAKISELPENISITGADMSMNAIKASRTNAIAAGLGNDIQLTKAPIEKFTPPADGGTLIINPPYGQRLKNEDMINFYRMIGDRLKKQFNGYTAWILSSHKKALKNIGLKTSKKLLLYNGSLECKFHKFEIYHGSRKQKNPDK